MVDKKDLEEVGEETRKEEMVKQFANSVRGQWIIGQALHIAVEQMKKEKHPEHSNIEDMEFLRDNAFPMYHQTHKIHNDPHYNLDRSDANGDKKS